MNTNRLIGVGKDANALTIVGAEISIEQFMRHGEQHWGMAVQISKYSLDDVLLGLLEDYDIDVIIKNLKQLNS